jgi:hypothetical protein
MKFRAVVVLVLIGLALLLAACGKGKESSPKDEEPSSKDDEKPKAKRASASASESASASAAPLGAGLGDAIPSLGDGHADIPGVKPGVTISCRDTMVGNVTTHTIVKVGAHGWVQATGSREYERALGGPYWMQLGAYPCNLVALPERAR